MNDDLNTTSLAVTDEYEAYPLAAGEEEAAPLPVAAAHRLLRGRYHWALGLGLLLGVLGGVIASLLMPPVYRSAGLIEVAPKVPRVLYNTPENSMMPMFEAFLRSQAALAKSRRAVDMAMQSPEWKALGRGRSDEEVGFFMNRMNVEMVNRTQLIEIAFSDEDPHAAVVGANEVIKAYMKLVREREDKSGLSTVAVLDNQLLLINAQLAQLREDVVVVTDTLGPEVLQSRYQFRVTEINKLDSMVNTLDVEIATMKASGDANKVTPGRPLTVEEVALQDPTVAQLLAQKVSAESHVASLVADGAGSRHPDFVAAKRAVAAIEESLNKHVAAYQKRAGKIPPDQRASDLRILKLRRDGVALLRDKMQDELQTLGEKRSRLEKLQADEVALLRRLDEVKRRMEQIDVESEVSGRISVLSVADNPVSAFTDRRLAFAGAAAAGGFALGFLLVFAWGLLGARMRHVEDVGAGVAKGRFVGILPDILDEASIHEPVSRAQSFPHGDAGASLEMGDYCVHHIRTLLQLRSKESADGTRVIAVTSPSAGAGKTTLGLALGMSFGGTGSRTLLVDCDFVGHGLTTYLRALLCDGAQRALDANSEGSDEQDAMESSPVSLLLSAHHGRYDDAAMDRLLETSRTRMDDGDDALVRAVDALEGYARYRDGRTLGRFGRRGVLDALNGAALEDCILKTDCANLAVLPVGDADASDAQRLSPAALTRLVAKCRERYDTVLIDTGPVLGSLEAAFVAAAVDHVLFILARGERKPLVDEALGRLEDIGADVAGIVFNRASNADVARSRYTSRSVSTAAEVV